MMENPYDVEWFYSSNLRRGRHKHNFLELMEKNSSLSGLERLASQMSSLKAEKKLI